mmetsp:Transcript_8137/g.18723  ORF Transcript_8137/g.18723 Transcript_8137/m.18723 type:complete len:184 (+) Transcript_8137:567-1118(+)
MLLVRMEAFDTTEPLCEPRPKETDSRDDSREKDLCVDFLPPGLTPPEPDLVFDTSVGVPERSRTRGSSPGLAGPKDGDNTVGISAIPCPDGATRSTSGLQVSATDPDVATFCILPCFELLNCAGSSELAALLTELTRLTLACISRPLVCRGMPLVGRLGCSPDASRSGAGKGGVGMASDAQLN